LSNHEPDEICMNILVAMGAAALFVAAARVLARALPAQNVALIVGSLIASELVLQAIWSGPGLLRRDLLSWPAVVLWARVGIRWFLRRRRQDWNYGVWLIVLASAAAALVQFAIALSGAKWNVAVKLSALRFAAGALCLFWLSPWFISKLPQQPQERAQ
jgi:hypothetical protein